MTKLINSKMSLDTGVLLMLLVIGGTWVKSSFGKVTGGEFVAGMGKTAGFFASKNPYPFAKEFLLGTVIPNSSLFGALTMWGEVFVGLSLVISIIYMLITKQVTKVMLLLLLAGLTGGIFLNGIFWLAAGWTSPSTSSVNTVMLGVQVVGLVQVFLAFKKVS